jgi:hypothetical protein
MWRSRWAAVGAAVAVSLGAGGLFVAQAAPGPSESTIVTVTPERVLDTRDPNNLGLAGPFTSPVAQKLQVTGSIPTATGTKTVVPTGATGVLLNVTPVNMTANGFISIRPGDATGAATTSSLNFTTGVAGVVPNAVQVAMPTAGPNAGKIDITYDAYGQAGPTTDILIDIVGYMTSTGLQELVADVAAKANTADVYTKSQIGAGYFTTSGALGQTVPGIAGIIGFTGGEQTVATLNLPAGQYVVNGSLVLNNNAATQASFGCELYLGATVIDSMYSSQLAILGPDNSPGSRVSVAFTSGGTLATPGTAEIRCRTTSTNGNYLSRSITALQVGTLTGPALALSGDPAIDDSE